MTGAWRWNRRDVWTGLIAYAAGDGVAALVSGQFQWLRLAGMMVVGATLYAWEVPACFRWIDRRVPSTRAPVPRALGRTALATLYFNPLWISRHLLFVLLFSGRWEEIGWSLLRTGGLSWIANIPLSVIGNYIIQVKLPLRWRFIGSAIFSGLMAIFYALCGEYWR